MARGTIEFKDRISDAMSRMGSSALKNFAMEIVLLLLVGVLIAFAPGFASLGNFFNVLRTVSMLGIVAFGMTAVIIAGEIDLSVGAGAGLAGCIVAWFAATTFWPAAVYWWFRWNPTVRHSKRGFAMVTSSSGSTNTPYLISMSCIDY